MILITTYGIVCIILIEDNMPWKSVNLAFFQQALRFWSKIHESSAQAELSGGDSRDMMSVIDAPEWIFNTVILKREVRDQSGESEDV